MIGAESWTGISYLWFGSRIVFTIVMRDIWRGPLKGNLNANFSIIT